MAAVIAYQSLNSNSSTSHNLAASTGQTFTRKAQRMSVQKYPDGSGSLKYPTGAGFDIEPHIAMQGPAELLPVASEDFMDARTPSSRKRKRSDDDELDGQPPYKRPKHESKMLTMVEGKARQVYQMSHRELSSQCDVIVFGEMDSSHTDWQSVSSSAGQRICGSMPPKACNCFSMHGNESTAKYISEGTGWLAARCNDVLVVFVHVPNSVATKKSEAQVFYRDVYDQVLNSPGGGVVDVFIGDTNQPSESFSPAVISEAIGKKFVDAHSKGSPIKPVDTWARGGVEYKGTNSVDNKKFDVALCNSETVKKIEVKYFTQLSHFSGQAAAYTDHMGVLVKVEKK